MGSNRCPLLATHRRRYRFVTMPSRKQILVFGAVMKTIFNYMYLWRAFLGISCKMLAYKLSDIEKLTNR